MCLFWSPSFDRELLLLGRILALSEDPRDEEAPPRPFEPKDFSEPYEDLAASPLCMSPTVGLMVCQLAAGHTLDSAMRGPDVLGLRGVV